VFFRASTQEEAEKLGLTGYARNLPDRRVEVLACGDLSAISKLKNWLSVGPPLAQVTNVSCQSIEVDEIPASFTTG